MNNQKAREVVEAGKDFNSITAITLRELCNPSIDVTLRKKCAAYFDGMLRKADALAKAVMEKNAEMQGTDSGTEQDNSGLVDHGQED